MVSLDGGPGCHWLVACDGLASCPEWLVLKMLLYWISSHGRWMDMQGN